MSKDPLLLTKLGGAVLVAAWIGVAGGIATWLLYKPGVRIDEPVYPLLDAEAVDMRPSAPDVPEAEPSAPDVAEAEPSAPEAETAPAIEAPDAGIGARLVAADAAAGQKVAKKCAACHSFDKGGKHKVGPNLWDLIDRGIGAAEGYSFSAALSGLGGTWGYEQLDAFLAAPKDFASGTKMTFAGIRGDADRADLIAYLRSLSDNPKPLP